MQNAAVCTVLDAVSLQETTCPALDLVGKANAVGDGIFVASFSGSAVRGASNSSALASVAEQGFRFGPWARGLGTRLARGGMAGVRTLVNSRFGRVVSGILGFISQAQLTISVSLMSFAVSRLTEEIRLRNARLEAEIGFLRAELAYYNQLVGVIVQPPQNDHIDAVEEPGEDSIGAVPVSISPIQARTNAATRAESTMDQSEEQNFSSVLESAEVANFELPE
jgi:hypothetical protein